MKKRKKILVNHTSSHSYFLWGKKQFSIKLYCFLHVYALEWMNQREAKKIWIFRWVEWEILRFFSVTLNKTTLNVAVLFCKIWIMRVLCWTYRTCMDVICPTRNECWKQQFSWAIYMGQFSKEEKKASSSYHCQNRDTVNLYTSTQYDVLPSLDDTEKKKRNHFNSKHSPLLPLLSFFAYLSRLLLTSIIKKWIECVLLVAYKMRWKKEEEISI